MSINEAFTNGQVLTVKGNIETSCKKFTAHPKFQGVTLKHLVTGEQTDNRLSCYLVRVDKFCTLDTHTHPEQVEIHEVISGVGECTLGESTTSYVAGTVSIMPQGVAHKVVAGAEPLYILATLSPALP